MDPRQRLKVSDPIRLFRHCPVSHGFRVPGPEVTEVEVVGLSERSFSLWFSAASLETRAAAHRALGDEHRLRLVDCLVDSDRTPGELVMMTGMSSNLLAFHLKTLEAAGLVERQRSEGDARRHYVRLRNETLPTLVPVGGRSRAANIVFVCTRNSARSQFAEAVWRTAGGCDVWSAGTAPADRVHPRAVAVARGFGIDLSLRHPKGFDQFRRGWT